MKKRLRYEFRLSLGECNALQQVASAFFRKLKVENPDWTVADLLGALEIETSWRIEAIALSAGFQSKVELSIGESRNETDPIILAGQERPKKSAGSAQNNMAEAYGKSPYGESPYGRNRDVSSSGSWVQRKVTHKGQLSYRGHLYSLGKRYRSRTAWVQENHGRITAKFKDRPALDLPLKRTSNG